MKKNKDNMRTGSVSTTEKLFYENEIQSNKLGIACILGCNLLVTAVGVLAITGTFGEEYIWVGWFGMVWCICIFFLYLFMKWLGYENRKTKYLVLICMIILGSITYVMYSRTVAFMFYIAPVLSIKYYDPKLTLKTTIGAWLGFMLTVVLNSTLHFSSDAIHALHENQGALWNDFSVTMAYNVIPKTIMYIVEGIIAYHISESGKNLVRKQASISTEAAVMSAELNTASQVQEASLPDSDFTTPDGNIKICADIRTARDVGGDFYDYFMINDHLLVVTVADVSDKGLPSAMYGVEAQSYLRFAFSESFHKDISGNLEYINLEKAVNAVNRQLSIYNMDGMFVTMWIGCFDTRTGVGKFVNAGHNPPFIRHANGELRPVTNEPQFFLGAFENAELQTQLLRLRKGDTLVLYTDGVTDARNQADESFGEERLKSVVKNTTRKKDETTSESIRRTILEDVTDFIGEEALYDDATIMILSYDGVFHSEKAELSLETGLECATNVIDFVNEKLAGYECPEEFRRNMDTVIDELCTNISMYAYDGEAGPLKVRIHLGNNFISLRFIDEGIAFNPLESMDPDINGEPQIGGLGIYLVKNLTDQIVYRYEDGKNILTVYSSWNI